jgi:hypothetical protein
MGRDSITSVKETTTTLVVAGRMVADRVSGQYQEIKDQTKMAKENLKKFRNIFK